MIAVARVEAGGTRIYRRCHRDAHVAIAQSRQRAIHLKLGEAATGGRGRAFEVDTSGKDHSGGDTQHDR